MSHSEDRQLGNSRTGVTGEVDRFKAAWRGWWWCVRNERHIQVHLAVATGLVPVGIGLELAILEWCVILLCVGLVVGLEIVNTAIEQIMDRIQPNYDPDVGLIKDIAAGAVLWAAAISAVIGIVILGHRILERVAA